MTFINQLKTNLFETVTTVFSAKSVKTTPITTAEIARQQTLAATSVNVAASVFGVVLAAMAIEFNLGSPQALALLGVLAWVTAFLGLLSHAYHRSCSAIESVEESKKLYQACEQTAAGQTYRQAVIAQGRNFVRGELDMLLAWNRKAQGLMAGTQNCDTQL